MGDLPWLKNVFIQIYKSRDLTLLSGQNSAIESKLILYFGWWFSATSLIGLKKGLMANKTATMQCNASQCDWTFSLTISVEIQFLSAWCNWDAPALWSICIWIIGRSWDASILAWYVKTVHRKEGVRDIFWDGKCMYCLQNMLHVKEGMAYQTL